MKISLYTVFNKCEWTCMYIPRKLHSADMSIFTSFVIKHMRRMRDRCRLWCAWNEIRRLSTLILFRLWKFCDLLEYTRDGERFFQFLVSWYAWWHCLTGRHDVPRVSFILFHITATLQLASVCPHSKC